MKSHLGRLAPPVDELHVWRVELGGEQPSARRAASRAALRQVLAAYLGEDPATIRLTEGGWGKPRLAMAPERLDYNLSHSGELALIAVTRGCAVGVDVEWINPERDGAAIAERALPAADAAAVREAPADERAAVFHQLWACHEARLKCLGAGLMSPPPEIAEEVVAEPLQIDPGYAAAVAVAAAELPPLRCWTFGPPLQGAV